MSAVAAALPGQRAAQVARGQGDLPAVADVLSKEEQGEPMGESGRDLPRASHPVKVH